MSTHQKAVLNGIWHVILPDRSEGLIVNGVAIVGTFQGRSDLDIKSMAEALATAQGETVKRLYLPVPPFTPWVWSDIPEMMVGGDIP